WVFQERFHSRFDGRHVTDRVCSYDELISGQRLKERASPRLEFRTDGSQKIAHDISAQYDRQGCADPGVDIGPVPGEYLLTPYLQLPKWVKTALIRTNNFERANQLHGLEARDNWGRHARVPEFDARLRPWTCPDIVGHARGN